MNLGVDRAAVVLTIENCEQNYLDFISFCNFSLLSSHRRFFTHFEHLFMILNIPEPQIF